MLLDKRIPVWYVVSKIRYELVYVVVVSVATFLITYFYKKALPEIPITIPVFLGTAISVLLSFKLSQSYDRWWEARKIWGSIVNDSRTLSLQVLNFPEEKSSETESKIVLRQIAWCKALSYQLRAEHSKIESLKQYLNEKDYNYMIQHNNKALALLNLHAEDFRTLRKNGQLDEFRYVQLDNTLVRLCESQGKAERIKGTVFPVSYRLFLRIFILIFVITLSLALQNLTLYFELPFLILISSAFFLLERTAYHIQDPFENKPNDTAMTQICHTIETNLKQLIHHPELPEKPLNNKFYVL